MCMLVFSVSKLLQKQPCNHKCDVSMHNLFGHDLIKNNGALPTVMLIVVDSDKTTHSKYISESVKFDDIEVHMCNNRLVIPSNL